MTIYHFVDTYANLWVFFALQLLSPIQPPIYEIKKLTSKIQALKTHPKKFGWSWLNDWKIIFFWYFVEVKSYVVFPLSSKHQFSKYKKALKPLHNQGLFLAFIAFWSSCAKYGAWVKYWPRAFLTTWCDLGQLTQARQSQHDVSEAECEPATDSVE